MDLQLAGKIAVVTGASKGIGLAVTSALVDAGVVVVAGARSAGTELPRLVESGQVVFVPVDLSTASGPQTLIDRAAEVGGMDILVNNAGAVTPRPAGFGSVTDADWERTLGLTLMAAVRTTRAALPHLRRRGGGSIITISSVNAYLPDPVVIDYSAAKAALSNFCKALSKEVGAAGIRVNTISPGPVETALWLGEHGVAETLARSGRSTAAEVARSAAAGGVTGRFTRPARSPTWSCCWPVTAPATSPVPTSPSTEDWFRPSDATARRPLPGPPTLLPTRGVRMSKPRIDRPYPVLFIHGLWIHSSAWRPWQELFEEAGYRTSAPGWPGDGATVQQTREHPEALEGVGIDDICRHYADLIDSMPVRPLVVGHSFGGLIAQELLSNNSAVAAVAIDPAPIRGVKILPFSQLRSGLPVLGNPANRNRTVSLTAEQFRYSFGNTLTDAESDALHEQWTIPGPGRPLFEDAMANFRRHSPAAVDTHHAARGPLLLITGTQDHTVPASVTEAVFKLYADNPSVTDLHTIDGRGHSLTIDSGWRDVADVALSWIAAHEVATSEGRRTLSTSERGDSRNHVRGQPGRIDQTLGPCRCGDPAAVAPADLMEPRGEQV